MKVSLIGRSAGIHNLYETIKTISATKGATIVTAIDGEFSDKVFMVAKKLKVPVLKYSNDPQMKNGRAEAVRKAISDTDCCILFSNVDDDFSKFAKTVCSLKDKPFEVISP